LIRYCEDIGMFVLDRGRASCRWKTTFCTEHCYNKKFYNMNIGLLDRDKKNDLYWAEIDGKDIQNTLDRKRKSTKRFRFCTRGEPFSTMSDIILIENICKHNPDTKFYAPTRAWRSTLRDMIETCLFLIPNLFITASIDPSNTQEEVDELVADGWSTGFFGNDNKYPFIVTPDVVKCPAKWGDDVSCANCNVACFNPKQTHHWLKEH
jgi:hypothetical protein